jgi:flagellar assembly protein FliH
MSDIIKLNPRSNKMNVKVASYNSSAVEEDESMLLKKQLDESYARGFKDAQEKTRRDIEQDYTQKLIRKYEEVYNILKEFDDKFVELEKYFERLVIITSFEMAKKVVQHEIESSSVINENVKISISKIIGANDVHLKMHPLDIEELTEASKSLIHSSSFNRIKIEPDERIERGGCLIETEIGSVDARISTQLNELKKCLEDNIEKKT